MTSKLFSAFFRWMNTWSGSHTNDRQKFGAPVRGGLVKLWRPSRTMLLGTMILVSSALVVGQAVNGTLLGTVTDSSGAVVASANITITEKGTGMTRNGVTNASGNYEVPSLPPGRYEVTVKPPGFRQESRPGVELTVNSTVRVNLRLQPGGATETLVVTAETPIVQAGTRIMTCDAPRRAGDLPVLVAATTKVARVRGWHPRHSQLTTIIQAAWKWHSAQDVSKPRTATGLYVSAR